MEHLKPDRVQISKLFSNMLNGFAFCRIVTDREGKPIDYVYLEVNDAFEKMTGAKRGNILGKRATTVFPHEEYLTRLISTYGRIALSMESAVFEDYRESVKKWYRVSAYSPRNGYFISILEDITDRKKAEQKIRENEEHLRALSDLTTEGILIHENGTVLEANDALARMFGYNSASETIGMSGFPMITPESQKKMKEHIATGSEETYELTGIRKDGTLFPIEVRARNMLYQGRLVRVGSIFDITERKKTEDALKDTTQKYGLLFDTTSDGVSIHNLKGQILEVNDAYCHMSGYTRAELIGMPISKLEAVETPEEIAVHIKKVLASGGHDRFESRHRRKDGSVFDTDITALYLEREGGQIAIFVRDITQRKKAEEALRESEKKFKTLAENAPDAIMRFDTNLRVLYLNPQDIAATGIPLAEFIGKTNEETGMPKELVKLWNEMFDRAKITKQGQQTEFDFSTHTGTRTFSLRIVPEFAEDGSLISYMGISRDITERKKAEEALKESEARFRTMADGTPSMLWVTDKEGKNQFVNRYFQLYFGVSSEQVEEIKWLRLLHPEDASHYVERFLEAVKEHRSFTAQARVRRTDGVWRWVETIATARYSPQGEFLGHVGITSDITEQKEAQQRLEEYSKNLEKTVEERTRQLADADRLAAIGATAGMVGHDIRNPLQAIEAAVYLSKHEIKGLPKQALVRKNLEEILNSISEQASYMNKIISDLQDFAGTPKPHIEELDIKDTLTSALSEIQIPMNVEILRIIPQSLPKMKGDKVYIRRTLTNLITNAIQAMPDGGTLTLKIIRDKHEDFVKVSIKDTGTGISKENQQKIFKPLFTTKAKGQGFGLAVAKKLVQAQGGELTFRSREGRGTTFTLRMPSSRGEMMNKNAE